MLRRAATKALGVNGAGSNPMLWLCLTDNMQNDPGVFTSFVIAFLLCEDWQGKHLIFCIGEGCGTALFQASWHLARLQKSPHVWIRLDGKFWNRLGWGTMINILGIFFKWMTNHLLHFCMMLGVNIWLRKATIVPCLIYMALTTAWPLLTLLGFNCWNVLFLRHCSLGLFCWLKRACKVWHREVFGMWNLQSGRWSGPLADLPSISTLASCFQLVFWQCWTAELHHLSPFVSTER